MDADELYRRAPEQFTAARDAAARERRAAGDRDGAAALRALRRPSVSAWLVNRAVQDEPGLIGPLLELGPQLAQAQAHGDAAAVRGLGAQRHGLVEAVTATVVERGGRPVSAAVRAEVHATLDAALSDPASAAAVRSGRLVRALSYAGLGEVDLADAVAPATGGASGAPDRAGPAQARERAAVRAAEQAAQEAAGALDDAVRAGEAAERRRARAARAAAQAAAEVERRAAELADAERLRDEAQAQERAAQEEHEGALAAVERAQDEAESARARLEELRRDTGS